MKLRSDGLGGLTGGAARWDPLLAFCRLRLMGDITRRCPLNGRDMPAQFKSCMPDHVREISKMDYAAARAMRRAVPTAREITLRDQTVEWIGHLEELDRVVAWGYAVGESSREIEVVMRDWLRVKLSYRAIQNRFGRLIEDLPRYWNARGFAVDPASVVEAGAAVERQAMVNMRTTPRSADGITYVRPERGTVGESRTILVDLPVPRYRRRAVEKSSMQASQIRA